MSAGRRAPWSFGCPGCGTVVEIPAGVLPGVEPVSCRRAIVEADGDLRTLRSIGCGRWWFVEVDGGGGVRVTEARFAEETVDAMAPVSGRLCAMGCGLLAEGGDVYCAGCRSGVERLAL